MQTLSVKGQVVNEPVWACLVCRMKIVVGDTETNACSCALIKLYL